MSASVSVSAFAPGTFEGGLTMGIPGRNRTIMTAAMLVFGAALALPAGASGSFTDIASSVHAADIEALSGAGITKGCNPPANDRFCPDDSVTRGQMAAFLARALELPAAAGDAFFDDDGSEFEAQIQAIASAGITRGCNPPANDRFCPDDAVTRGEMAAFLVRAFDPEPVRSVPPFVDTAGSVFAADAALLAAAGIAKGCNPPANDRFCPDDRLSRGQMASFLVRSLGLAVSPRSFTFAAGGDIGAGPESDAALASMASNAFFLALGDLSYSDLTPETAWCSHVLGLLGGVPIEVVGGNHEEDSRTDGFIGAFAACAPDSLGATGLYGSEYYFDFAQLVRVIMISPDLTVDGEEYQYRAGSAHETWLVNAIRAARAKAIPWVVVGMHKNCVTAGQKSCEISQDLARTLIAEDVDLVLQGHDHTYQRSKSLSCVTEGSFEASCVADDGADGVYPRGQGTVFVIAGATGGGNLYPIDPADAEFGYFAATMGAGDAGAGRGYAEVQVTATALTLRFVPVTATFTDSFSVR
jgi:hypothetical protein